VKCKKCGQELLDGDVFCGSCGCKVEPEQSESKNIMDENKEKSSGKKKTLPIILGIIAIVVILVFVVIGMQPKDLHMEASTLGDILNTKEEEAYYGDTLFVHGFLLRDSEKPNVFMLHSSSSDDEKKIEVLYEAGLDESLGDRSEIIVKGQIGYLNDEPDVSLLLGEEIEVVKAEERVHSFIDVDDLFANADNCVESKVSVTGYVETGGWFGPYMMNASFTRDIALWNLTEEQQSEMNMKLCTVVGVFDYIEGDPYIQVESIEILTQEEELDEVITYFDNVNELLVNSSEYIGKTVSFEGWTDVEVYSDGNRIYYIANGSEPIYLYGISNIEGESVYGGYCLFTGVFDQDRNGQYYIYVEMIG